MHTSLKALSFGALAAFSLGYFLVCQSCFTKSACKFHWSASDKLTVLCNAGVVSPKPVHSIFSIWPVALKIDV